VAGVAEGAAHLRMRRDFQIVIDRIEALERSLRLRDRVERRDVARRRSPGWRCVITQHSARLVTAIHALAEAIDVGILGFLFLDVRRIGQHHRQQVAGGTRGMNGAVETERDQARQ